MPAVKVICITQARMGSARLPGKVLQLIHNRTMLEYHLMRVEQAKLVDTHIVATTNRQSDLPIVEYCKQCNQKYFCGDEQDVLSRFYLAAINAGAAPDDIIVRLTGDCPLICAELIDDAIIKHQQGGSSQYTHVSLNYFPRGFDVEVFSMALLTDAYTHAKTAAEREHVTLYLYTNENAKVVPLETGKSEWSLFRLCVDEAEDMQLVTEIIAHLGDNWLQASPAQICQLLVENEQLVMINKKVQQRSTH